MQTWSIEEFAEQSGSTQRTLRQYEDLGLLNRERHGSERAFDPQDRSRLQLVLRGRRLGFSLTQIRTIVNMYDEQPGDAHQLEYLLDQIEVRRTELERLRREIADTERELDEVRERCRQDLAATTARVSQVT